MIISSSSFELITQKKNSYQSLPSQDTSNSYTTANSNMGSPTLPSDDIYNECDDTYQTVQEIHPDKLINGLYSLVRNKEIIQNKKKDCFYYCLDKIKENFLSEIVNAISYVGYFIINYYYLTPYLHSKYSSESTINPIEHAVIYAGLLFIYKMSVSPFLSWFSEYTKQNFCRSTYDNCVCCCLCCKKSCLNSEEQIEQESEEAIKLITCEKNQQRCIDQYTIEVSHHIKEKIKKDIECSDKFEKNRRSAIVNNRKLKFNILALKE